MMEYRTVADSLEFNPSSLNPSRCYDGSRGRREQARVRSVYGIQYSTIRPKNCHVFAVVCGERDLCIHREEVLKRLVEVLGYK